MKFIYGFEQFLNESQSKKIKKYFSYSVALQWYRENKTKIASILGVAPEKMVSENDLLAQTNELVNNVINTQSVGDDGNIGRAGFESFEKLEQHIIHDILHNMYHVQKKEFTKRIDRQEYSESEIIEEIECLGIEESFMKYMNMPYLNTDFINQNINQLVSHLMLTILRHDTDRVVDILNGKVEPYIEVYGKKYEIKGTPFEGIFELFKDNTADPNFGTDKWSSYQNFDEDDLREYLIRLINVGVGIGDSSGDRAQYPNNDYFGDKPFEELGDYEREYVIENALEDLEHLVLNDGKVDLDDLKEKDLFKELNPFLRYDRGAGEEEQEDYGYDENQLKIPFNESVSESVSEAEFDYMRYIKVKIKKMIATKPKDDYRNISDDPDDYIIKINNEKSLVWDAKSLLSQSEFRDICENEYQDNYPETYDSDHWFIDRDSYGKKTTKELVDYVLDNEDSSSIMRRNFRKNDVVQNNSKLGLGEYEYDKKIHTKSTENNQSIYYRKGNYKAITFYRSEAGYDYPSLSKNLFTENAKKLHVVLSELRGYVIKNFDKIKTKQKENKSKFTKQDIDTFRRINMNEFKAHSEKIMAVKSLKPFVLEYNIESYTLSETTGTMSALVVIYKYKLIATLMSKVNSQEDIDYLFNWVNMRGVFNFEEFAKIPTISETLIKHIDKLLGELTPQQKAFSEYMMKDVRNIFFNRLDNNETQESAKRIIESEILAHFAKGGKCKVDITWDVVGMEKLMDTNYRGDAVIKNAISKIIVTI
jgi:hypothetical protein